MADWFKEQINETAGKEFLVPCIKCAGKTSHSVVVSVDQSGYEEDAEIQWDDAYQIVKCKGCSTVSFRKASCNSEDFLQVGEDEYVTEVTEKLYPSRVEGMKDLGGHVFFLPSDLRRVYAETVQALNSDLPVLAGIGLRALVETVCKEKKAEGGDLYHKINDLASKHILTPTGAAVLHKVRTLGNDAAHEVKPHTQKQLSLAMSVVEHMLKDVYILHKLIENEF